MVELIQAQIDVHGEEPRRCYVTNFRWSNGVQQQAVIYENEFPKRCAEIQKLIDDTEGMNVVDRLRHIDATFLIKDLS
jgi:hypothetical protein